MILIDETKLTKDVLARVLDAQGVNIDKYVKKVYTEEQIEYMADNLKKSKDKDKELIEQFKESLRVMEYIHYDELFDNELKKFQVQVGNFKGVEIPESVGVALRTIYTRLKES